MNCTMEHSLTDAIADRLEGADGHSARVLAASVAGAVRIALEQWRPATESLASTGLIMVSGALSDELRAALSPLAPAFDAAEKKSRGAGRR